MHPFISSFFFLSNFQTLKFFVTLFSGTVRPGRLILGIQVDSGQMYCVYWNQAAAAYLPLYFFIFLSLLFSNIKIFCHTQWVWGLGGWNLVHTWTMSRCMVIPESGCCCSFVPLFLHFSFSPIFKQEMWGLLSWNLIHTWTLGGCIMCTAIRLILLICLLFLYLSFSPIFRN